MCHDGITFVGDTVQTNDRIVTTNMWSTFIESWRCTFGFSISIEIDLLEDQFVGRRINRWNIRSRPFDVRGFVRWTLTYRRKNNSLWEEKQSSFSFPLTDFYCIFFVFLIGIIKCRIIIHEVFFIIVIDSIRSTFNCEYSLEFLYRFGRLICDPLDADGAEFWPANVLRLKLFETLI